MNNEEVLFLYRNARGEITARRVSDISETDDYLQGYCHMAEDLRTFRKDRILETLEDDSDIDAKYEYHKRNSPEPKGPPKSHHLADVCFTGFKSEDKKRLIDLSEQHGLIVRSSVTRALNYLCCGYNAGPKKIEKARSQGVVAVNEQQFLAMLETGELPEC